MFLPLYRLIVVRKHVRVSWCVQFDAANGRPHGSLRHGQHMTRAKQLKPASLCFLAQVVGYEPGTVALGQPDQDVTEANVPRRASREVRETGRDADQQAEPKIGEELLDLACEGGGGSGAVFLARGDGRDDDVVSARIAGLEDVVVAAGHGESALVSVVQHEQGRPRLDL